MPLPGRRSPDRHARRARARALGGRVGRGARLRRHRGAGGGLPVPRLPSRVRARLRRPGRGRVGGARRRPASQSLRDLRRELAADGLPPRRAGTPRPGAPRLAGGARGRRGQGAAPVSRRTGSRGAPRRPGRAARRCAGPPRRAARPAPAGCGRPRPGLSMASFASRGPLDGRSASCGRARRPPAALAGVVGEVVDARLAASNPSESAWRASSRAAPASAVARLTASRASSPQPGGDPAEGGEATTARAAVGASWPGSYRRGLTAALSCCGCPPARAPGRGAPRPARRGRAARRRARRPSPAPGRSGRRARTPGRRRRGSAGACRPASSGRASASQPR